MQFLTTTSEGYISLFFTLALMLVLLYFMIYRPQKKQEKKDAAMRNRRRPCEDPLYQDCHRLCREAEHGQG